MTFTEPGALGQSELQVEGAMTFFGAPCEAGRDGASGMALLWQRPLSHSLTHSNNDIKTKKILPPEASNKKKYKK